MSIHTTSIRVAYSLPLLIGAALTMSGPTTTAGDDAAWLREKGTLLFEDSFDREEDGNLAAAVGNGWESATANRVPDVKQADLDGGVLKVINEPRAGHAPHIHHDAGFEDGGAIVRFKLPDAEKPTTLTVGFVDRQTPGVHAGHLCYALVSTQPPRIQLVDYKTGVMNLEIRKQRQPYLDKKEPLPADLAALLATKTKELPWAADHEWHELVLVTQQDEMRVTLDGKPLGSHRSEGFGHPTKRWFSLLMNPSAWIDDVKVYKVK
ncbi:MAG: hypothetical protein K8S94_07510 [Planctomycetia bacterium]|nr:hypothetical protein [Planctomycetia bacterium]